MIIAYYFLCFFIFSFVGWSFESILCSYYNDSHFINRGFLIGPYCPIYGFGGLFCFLCFGKIGNIFLLFISAAISCTILEYLTSFLMEKLLHAKWWDYSHLPFNIKGRVCLYGTVLFGILAVLTCRVIAPQLMSFFVKMPDFIIIICATVISAAMFADAIFTFLSWSNLNSDLKTIYASMTDTANNTMQMLSDSLNKSSHMKIDEVNNRIHIKTADINLMLHKLELRFFNAFPNLQIIPYADFIKKTELKKYINKLFRKHKHPR